MSDFIDQMKEVVGHLQQANAIVSRGPFEYYFRKLVEHSEALLTKFAPLKAGERAVIIGHVDCNNGWKGRERTLAVGAVGTIQSVDYRHGKFTFDWVPDHEYWTDHEGVEHEADTKHSYHLSARVLAPNESDV